MMKSMFSVLSCASSMIRMSYFDSSLSFCISCRSIPSVMSLICVFWLVLLSKRTW